MKIVRIVFGVLASLFVLMHLLELPRFLESMSQIPDDLHASRWLGKGAAIVIGTAIAIACFKPRAKKIEANKPVEEIR